MQIIEQPRQHISFSEAYTFSKCPYNHYTQYVLKQRSEETIYTKFGTLMGRAIEDKKKNLHEDAWKEFENKLCEWIDANPHIIREGKAPELIDKDEWIEAGRKIYNEVFVFLDKEFPGYQVLEFEFPIYEDVPEHHLKFKGYVDFIIKHEDKIWILDFKTTKKMWDAETLSDTEKLYQVTLYKKFFCDMFEIDPKDVETAYLLLKRAPWKDEPIIEIVKTTSGKVKMNNCIEWLKEQSEGIQAGIRVKKTNTCKFCSCGSAPKWSPKKKSWGKK